MWFRNFGALFLCIIKVTRRLLFITWVTPKRWPGLKCDIFSVCSVPLSQCLYLHALLRVCCCLCWLSWEISTMPENYAVRRCPSKRASPDIFHTHTNVYMQRHQRRMRDIIPCGSFGSVRIKMVNVFFFFYEWASVEHCRTVYLIEVSHTRKEWLKLEKWVHVFSFFREMQCF